MCFLLRVLDAVVSTVIYILLVGMQFGNILTTRYRTKLVIPLPPWLHAWAKRRQAKKAAAVHVNPWAQLPHVELAPPKTNRTKTLVKGALRDAAGDVESDAPTPAATDLAYEVHPPLMETALTIRLNSDTVKGGGMVRPKVVQVKQESAGFLYDSHGNLHQWARIAACMCTSALIAVTFTEGAAFHHLFNTEPVHLSYWFLGFALGGIMFFVGELRKWFITLFPSAFTRLIEW